ncbi:hypothetical protein EG329_002280 [Mollisiaceae sp. DMI_Dod_QoI]|nr:hypothetical protein EG329_002280 [Helotiales sp. DMI_Dod_QoI]
MFESTLKGDIVEGPPALHPDTTANNIILTGQHDVMLVPLIPEHTPGLFENLCGPENDNLYTWLPGGPFPDLESFAAHINFLLESPVFFGFTIFLCEPSDSGSSSTTPVGLIGLMTAVPANRSIEIGHVLFGPKLRRTAAATEVNYLLMKYAFEELHYQRVEWKTNNFNEASKRAALRLGYKFEGLFRKHMIVRGRRRDSSWYSCLDDEWFKKGKGGVKEALEKWLEKDNFDAEGKQKRTLEDFRDASTE